MGKLLDFPASFWPISLTYCVLKLLNTSFFLVCSSFWSRTLFFFPARPVSALDGLLIIKFFIVLFPFWMGLTNPGLFLRRFLLLSTSRKLSTLSNTPPFFTNLLQLVSLLALFVGLNFSFLAGALAWFSKSR